MEPRSLQLSASAPELRHPWVHVGRSVPRPRAAFHTEAGLSGLSWRPSSRAFSTFAKVGARGLPLTLSESHVAVQGSRSGIHGGSVESSLLCGLSPPIGFQNGRAEDDLESLAPFGSPHGRSPALPRIMTSPSLSLTMTLGFGPRSDQDFSASVDTLSTRIDELKRGLAHFDPGGQRSPAPADGPTSPKHRSHDDAEDEFGLQERLEAYKMGRRMEPELPPLTPYVSGIEKSKVSEKNNILARNMAGNSLKSFHPAKRRKTLATLAHMRQERRTLVGLQREDLLVQASVAFNEQLERKKQQGKQAIQNQKKNGDSKPGKKEAIGRWLAALATVAFAERLQQEREFKRMTFEEKMKLSDSAKTKFKRGGTMVLEAVQMGATTQDPLFQQRMLMFSCMIKSRTLRQNNRDAAKTLFEALSSWQKAGRCFVSLRRFANQVRKLQRFWRSSSKRLHEARDKVARRWMHIERKELVQELNKADPINPKDKGKPTPSGPKLSLEEKIQLALLAEEVRLRFISAELRTRRYMLLPAIQVWEQDALQWRKEMEEWRMLRQAHKTVDSEGHLEKGGFRWPPPRPSYLPADVGPLGYKGDKEILDMYKRARKNPNGWLKIPTTGGGLVQKETEAPREDKDRCPEPTEEDLRLFGVNPLDLPGIAAGGKPRADPENPEPGVAPV